MTRVAVVDLGTNSTRLLVADVEGGSIEEVDRRLTITRLGEGVDAGQTLLTTPIERVEACVAEYVDVASAHGATRRLAIATSAVRDAANGQEFLNRIEVAFGFETRLLSGDDEALLTFRGVCSDRDLVRPTLVVDLGGGSTELVVGHGRAVDFNTSLDIGCVRLTERWFRSDPPGVDDVARLRQDVRSAVAAHVPSAIRPKRAIGVAGTVTTLATVFLGLPEEDPERVHGLMMPAAWIAATAAELASTRIEELRRREGISSGRASVIGAGALALDEIVRFFGLDALEVSERDILHGAALELAA